MGEQPCKFCSASHLHASRSWNDALLEVRLWLLGLTCLELLPLPCSGLHLLRLPHFLSLLRFTPLVQCRSFSLLLTCSDGRRLPPTKAHATKKKHHEEQHQRLRQLQRPQPKVSTVEDCAVVAVDLQRLLPVSYAQLLATDGVYRRQRRMRQKKAAAAGYLVAADESGSLHGINSHYQHQGQKHSQAGPASVTHIHHREVEDGAVAAVNLQRMLWVILLGQMKVVVFRMLLMMLSMMPTRQMGHQDNIRSNASDVPLRIIVSHLMLGT